MKRLWYRARNVLRWLPVIWGDRDWDYVYLYEVMRHKLVRMESFIRREGHSMDRDETAGEIAHAIALLDRLIANEYLEEALAPFDTKWGEGTMVWESIEGSPACRYKGQHFANASTDEEQEQANLEFRERCKESDEAERLDREELFSFIAKNIRGWWD